MVKPGTLLAAAMLLIAACTNAGEAETMSGKFDWIASESAPREYPAYLIAGIVTDAEGKVQPLPDRRVVNNGWGELGSIHIVGEEFKALPKKLDFAWYSLLEDAFYRASIDLPQDVLLPAFKTGVAMPEGGKPVPFNRVSFGMAPGGDVAIWIGADRVVRQIGFFRGAPAKFELSDMSGDPSLSKQQFVETTLAAALSPDVLARVRSRPVPAGRWREYDQRFAWAPQSGQGGLLWVTTINGESNWFDLSGQRNPGTSANGPMAAPQKIEMTWKLPNGEGRLGEVEFDPEESLSALRAMTARTGGKVALQLILDPAETEPRIEVLLRGGNDVYRFTKTRSSIAPR